MPDKKYQSLIGNKNASLAPGEARDKRITLRVTETQRERYNKAAQDMGITTSAMIEMAIDNMLKKNTK